MKFQRGIVKQNCNNKEMTGVWLWGKEIYLNCNKCGWLSEKKENSFGKNKTSALNPFPHLPPFLTQYSHHFFYFPYLLCTLPNYHSKHLATVLEIMRAFCIHCAFSQLIFHQWLHHFDSILSPWLASIKACYCEKKKKNPDQDPTVTQFVRCSFDMQTLSVQPCQLTLSLRNMFTNQGP